MADDQRPGTAPSPADLARAARPGPPRPAPSPAPSAGPTASPEVGDAPRAAIPAVPEASGAPQRWGRVTEDGTVLLTAEAGEERAVGSWQAGRPEEGLAHFARRFDDLRTEADLLAHRLRDGQGDPRTVGTAVAALRERSAGADVVGDLPALLAALDAITAAVDEADRATRAARAEARDRAVARKEEILAEAEALATETTRWKHGGDRFAALLEEWKTLTGIDRKTDDALWKRFSRARESFNRRRGAHFAELDRSRTEAREHKEALVARAEAMTDATDWGPAAGRYKELMTQWKAAGRASKEADDALWSRFRAAQDTFFSRRSAAYAEQDSEFAANARAKEALVEEAGRIDLADTDAARAALRSVQERWDAIGKVPRERMRELSDRLTRAEERVRSAADRQWSRTDPEKQARLAQFRERVSRSEEQAAKARAAGDERRAADADREAAQWREWLTAAERATD